MKCLPVKSLLVHQGIAKVDQCEGCGSELETILHTLRDCAATKDFWQRANIDICNDNFFNVDLCSWLKNNLENSFKYDEEPTFMDVFLCVWYLENLVIQELKDL